VGRGGGRREEGGGRGRGRGREREREEGGGEGGGGRRRPRPVLLLACPSPLRLRRPGTRSATHVARRPGSRLRCPPVPPSQFHLRAWRELPPAAAALLREHGALSCDGGGGNSKMLSCAGDLCGAAARPGGARRNQPCALRRAAKLGRGALRATCAGGDENPRCCLRQPRRVGTPSAGSGPQHPSPSCKVLTATLRSAGGLWTAVVERWLPGHCW